MSAEPTRPAQTRRPWTPRVKQPIKDLFRAARIRLLREAELETDEDHIMEALVREYLDLYVTRVILSVTPPKEDK